MMVTGTALLAAWPRKGDAMNDALDKLVKLFVPDTYLAICKSLDKKPKTMRALSREIKVTEDTARIRLALLMKHKIIHIGSWQKSPTGYMVAIYALGGAENAPKPKNVVLTPSQRSSRWRKNGGDSHRLERLRKMIENPPKLGIFGV